MQELDTVVLTKTIGEHGLEKGDIGTVVHAYESGDAFEVEFVSGEGRTVAILTLPAADLRFLQQDEILHVRALSAA